jgi:hypothetical protein
VAVTVILYPAAVVKMEDVYMNCANVIECACPKKTCENNRQCCACIIKHKETDSFPFCLFPDNDGDKSVKNMYRKLYERFGVD